MPFASVEELVHDIARGRIVVLVDSEDRENEGDLVLAAEKATPESIRFLAVHGRGLVCAPVSPEIADRLSLPLMSSGADPDECAFTVSVDARKGISTGISAFDRAFTARLLADPRSRMRDFKRPGHLFPLRARAGGVLERPGHTEAAVDLARLAGLTPVGVICEVMNDDGTMARLPDLERLARHHGLRMGSIAQLIEYRQRHGVPRSSTPTTGFVRHLSSARLPTPFGVFEIHVFENQRDEEVLVLTQGALTRCEPTESRGVGSSVGGSRAADSQPADSHAADSHAADSHGDDSEPVLVRLHSACFTGDVLGSLRCDCGGQLQVALRAIGEAEQGILIYLPQEGRGIGLAKKIEAYHLQERGLDTVEANHALGFPPDLRTYEDAAAVLKWFGADRIRLLSNNPSKVESLVAHGIDVVERLSIEVGAGPVNHGYLRAKKGKLGHFFEAV